MADHSILRRADRSPAILKTEHTDETFLRLGKEFLSQIVNNFVKIAYNSGLIFLTGILSGPIVLLG